ncbi:hypothetical protein, partial [Acinetobacter baumannii]|uniref:hypothetical protein n=1 Tax=Acinetobacter baumannii TaxID=470 RepID=UPI001A7E4EC1
MKLALVTWFKHGHSVTIKNGAHPSLPGLRTSQGDPDSFAVSIQYERDPTNRSKLRVVKARRG